MSHYFNCLITIFIGMFVSSCLPDTIPVTYIGLNTTEIELILGDSDRESFQLVATVSPSDASNKQVHWSSSKGTVASVDHTGLVTALQVDDAPVIITATAEGGLTAECTVRVLKKTISVREVLLNKTSLEIQPGETATLIASVLPSNAANKELIWSSSDEFVATVSAGKVKGVGSGKAIITATSEDGGKEATCEVTVTGSEPDGPSDDNAIDLAVDGLYANSYIVSSTGDYKFQPVKGNSYESVGNVASVEVLWESFGTDVTPSVGDLVKEVSYSDGYILFSTADNFRKGNAVIAAKDLSGTILWSWHIWLTDEPEGQVYYNGAGTMMDRNLGATSATPGDAGALGLLYQWGRKDPFLSSSSISSRTVAKSTGSWPSTVSSSSSSGTIEYAVKNPMTFITANSPSGDDWHYSSTNNTRWQSEKTIYDPCPTGWRVPDGGRNGVWSRALGSSSLYDDTYDNSRKGINFSGKFGNASPIWYPASGCRLSEDGSLKYVGYLGYYWSCTPNSSVAYFLYVYINGNVGPSLSGDRASGRSVRCLQE